jgi:serine/threonine protein kinase
LPRWRRRWAPIHARGIIHRDLKPENIMLHADGTVALADFGIAKSMLKTENMAMTQTRHGDVVGTPYYLSPEQATGRPITPQSDLYSLGIMMFEMLTGKRPFGAETLEQLLAHHLHAPTPPLPAAARRVAAHREQADRQEALKTAMSRRRPCCWIWPACRRAGFQPQGDRTA